MIRRMCARWFRGIAEEQSFDIGGFTLLSGRNGLGKTTFFDAIDWCLFGSAWRLGDESSVRNLYRPDRTPEVEVELVLEGQLHRVRRTLGQAFLDGDSIEERELAAFIAEDIELFPPYSRDIQSRLRRVCYLSQGDMQTLIDPAFPGERDALLQALVGVPEAAAAQSGIRRIEEKLAARWRTVADRLAEIRDRIVETEKLGGAPDSAVLRRAPEYIEEARRLLGDVGGGESSEILRQLRERRLEMESALRAREALTARQKSVSEVSQSVCMEVERAMDELSEQRNKLEKFKQVLMDAQHAEESVRRQLDVVEEHRKSALGELTELRESLDTARRALEDKHVASHLRTDASQLRQTLKAASGEVEKVNAVLARVTESITAREEELATKRRDVERFDEVSALKERMRSWNQELAVNHQEREFLQSKLDFAERELEQAHASHIKAGKQLEDALAEADAIATIRDAVAQILPALKLLDLSTCPVCKTSFENSQHLLWRAEEQHSLNPGSERLERLRQAVSSTEEVLVKARNSVKSYAHAAGELDRRMVELKASLKSIEDKLAVAAEPIERPSETEIRTLCQELEELHGRSQAANKRLAELETEEESARVRLRVKEEELEELEVRLLETESSPEADIGAFEGRVKAIQGRLEAFQASASEIRGNLAALLAKRRDASTGKEETEQRTAEIQDAIRIRRERLVRERESVEAASREVFGAIVEDWEDRLQRELFELEARLSEVSDLSVVFERLATAEQLNLLNREAAALRLELISHEGRLEEIERARARFGEIAEAVRSRAAEEADRGFKAQGLEIQQCLDAIYPHGHLDELVDVSQDAVMVTDSLLAKPVRADLFYSTGQKNVLGLSIFLGVALRQRSSRLRSVLLDEPIQNLDDLNFLGLMTLLKRMALRMPVVLSTADSNAAEIIRRQMASTWERADSEFHWYHWSGFDPRSGPRVELRPAQRPLAA